MSEKWIKWTFLEASTKTISKIFQKIVGGLSAGWIQVFFATFVVGLVQIVCGFAMAKKNKKEIFTDLESILGSCLFGFNAAICTVLPFYVFVIGGDMGINTFIITLSIIPGALIDHFFFKHKLNRNGWIGITIAILAGYSILGWPSLSEIYNFDLWVWLSFAIALIAAINQGITQKIKKIDPFVKNFWGGLTTFVFSLIGLIVMNSAKIIVSFTPEINKIWLASGFIGLIVVAMWSFNLMSYKGGAHIAIKKLVMNGSYLTMAMIFGIIIFDESLTVGKIIGVILYFVAFSFMDKGTNEYVQQFFGKQIPITA